MRRFIGVIVALVMSISTNAQSDVDPMQYFGKGQILPASLDSGKLVRVRASGSPVLGSYCVQVVFRGLFGIAAKLN